MLITINQIKSNFSIRFVHRSGTKYSFGEMDEIGLIAPGPPGFFPRMVLNHSQWNLAHMELYPFFVSCKKRKICFFFLNGLSFCDYLPLIHSINFNVINNNFCVVDPFMLYMSYNLSASFISEQIIIN